MGIFDFFRAKKVKEVVVEDLEKDIEHDVEDGTDQEENYNSDPENYSKEYNYDFNLLKEEVAVSDVETEITEKEAIVENTNDIIYREIIKVIYQHKDFNTIQDAAKAAAANIGKQNISHLKDYLYDKVSKPAYMKFRFNGLGEWPKVVENSVLSILYAFEEDGVDQLLMIANTKKNTRYKAINLLCKLASKGIEREKIIDSIIYIMKSMDEDEIINILCFLSQIKNHQKVERLFFLYFKKFIFENKYDLAYETVINIINIKGRYNSENLMFLKYLALHDGELEVIKILEGEKGKIDLSILSEELRVKAAVSFYSLYKEDKEINDKLKYLKENSLDSNIRSYIASILA